MVHKLVNSLLDEEKYGLEPCEDSKSDVGLLTAPTRWPLYSSFIHIAIFVIKRGFIVRGSSSVYGQVLPCLSYVVYDTTLTVQHTPPHAALPYIERTVTLIECLLADVTLLFTLPNNVLTVYGLRIVNKVTTQ